MKKIFRYVIVLIALYLVVQLYVFLLMKQYYRDMKNYNVLVESPKIEVTESKVAKNKGYIKGKITNNTDEQIKNLKVKSNVEILCGVDGECIRSNEFNFKVCPNAIRYYNHDDYDIKRFTQDAKYKLSQIYQSHIDRKWNIGYTEFVRS